MHPANKLHVVCNMLVDTYLKELGGRGEVAGVPKSGKRRYMILDALLRVARPAPTDSSDLKLVLDTYTLDKHEVTGLHWFGALQSATSRECSASA